MTKSGLFSKPLLPEEEHHGRKLPLLFRINIPINGEDLDNVKLGPSHQFPGTISVKGVSKKDASYLSLLEEGDRVTHVNGIAIRGDLSEIRKIITGAGNNKAVDVQFMRKNNPFIQKPYHSEDGRAHSDDDAVQMDVTTTNEEADIHGKDLALFAYFLYEMREGDCLAKVADSFGIKIDDIRQDNRDQFELGKPGFTYTGEVLRIRNKDYIIPESSPYSSSEDLEAMSHHSNHQIDHIKRIRGYHEVRAGDTLDSIASLYDMTIPDVRRFNRNIFHTGEKGHLETGMKVLVFQPEQDGNYPLQSNDSFKKLIPSVKA